MKKLSNKGFLILWCSIFAVIAVIVIVLNCVAAYWDVALTQFFGTIGSSTNEIIDNNSDSTYFKTSQTQSELKAKELELCEQIAGEGIVLLKNEGNALPLASGAKVSLFGCSSVNTLTGGTGSGSTAATGTPTLKEVLTAAGFSVNGTLWDFYESGAAKTYGNGAGANLSGASSWALNEAPQSVYTDTVKDSYASFKDAAIVVFTRNNGEGNDLPRNMASYGGDANHHYLELTETEKELLTAVKAAGFGKTIVLINSASAMEIGFIDEDAYGIDACLQFGGTGENGLNAIGDIMNGELSPSGHLVDTYMYDELSTPAMQNFGDFKYSGADQYYVEESEGIYVGYRYTETRYEDLVLGQGNAGSFDYSSEVQFPFGFGLSYTSFTWSDYTVSGPDEEGNITVSVTVKNSGDTYSGKEVVGIYAQSPYTEYDKTNNVEKSSVELVGFAKTATLAPEESETLTIVVDKEDLASYDAYGAGTYILDAGRYYLTAASDAHEAINNILAEKGKTTADGMTAEGNADLVSRFDIENLDTTTYAKSKAGADVTNQLQFADINNSSSLWYDANHKYLTRSDWTGTFPTPYGTATSSTSTNANGYQYEGTSNAALLSQIGMTEYEASGNPKDKSSYTMPAYGQSGDMELIQLRGASFTDENWDALLNQLTLGEMKLFVGRSGYSVAKADSINMPASKDIDGPAGLNSFVGSDAGTSWPSEVLLASTWNTEIAKQMGEYVGEEALFNGVHGWYAPAMNIHRSAFAGRNFEYYSEDGFLSGEFGSAEVAGAQSKGLLVFIKHFAFNEQESHREGVGMWNNEQALREIYLDAFKTCIEENAQNGCMAVMTSYNRVGPTWTGGSYNLITGILRTEWGFNGMVLTDYGSSDYMDTDMMLAAGGDAQLRTGISNPTDSTSAAAIYLMRQAAKHICYSVVNSNAMNGIALGTKIVSAFPVYVLILIIIDVVAAVGIGAGVFFVIRRVRKKK